MRRVTVLAALVVAFVLATSSVAAATTRAVAISGFAFSPATKAVARGDFVKWTNSDGVPHTTTSNGALRWSKSLGPTASYTYTGLLIGGIRRGFFAAGAFAYVCTIHSGMSGRIVVPISVAPASGARGTRFAVRWAAITAPSGYRYQAAKRNAGSTTWGVWRTTTASAAAFSTTSTTPKGTYYFRARLQRWNGSVWVSSGWSAAKAVTVL